LPLGAQQGFYREYYAGISGGRVADLTAAAAFPDAPTVEEVVNSQLETGVNVADYYGQRVRALLTPTVTGSYTFWVATDDGGELWLGTDHLPASRRRIAYVSGWTNSREWTRELNQKSAPIALTAGTRYYIEVLQKENTGGDNLAVAWQVPGTTATNVIPAAVLTPFLDPPVIRTQPLSLDIEEQWAGLRSATFTVEAVRQGGVTYQWQRDGVNLPGATAPAYTLTADVANSNRLFRCVLSNLAGTVTSAAARYRFVPDVTAPALTAWNVFHDRRILTLGFSEPLDPASATNPAAYAVSGSAVLNATLLEDGAGGQRGVQVQRDPYARADRAGPRRAREHAGAHRLCLCSAAQRDGARSPRARRPRTGRPLLAPHRDRHHRDQPHARRPQRRPRPALRRAVQFQPVLSGSQRLPPLRRLRLHTPDRHRARRQRLPRRGAVAGGCHRGHRPATGGGRLRGLRLRRQRRDHAA